LDGKKQTVPITRMRQWRLFLAAMCAVAAIHAPAQAQSGTPSEYDVKAAFLYNFVKFVQFPANAAPPAGNPIEFCVYGDDPFGGSLDAAIQGKTINGHSLVARRIPRASELKSCQVIFISMQDKSRVPELLESARGSGALLVGESARFAEMGGHIQFTREGSKVRFAINPDAAARAGLEISSKLLALASIVHDKSGAR
jgi:hypothetical protein